MKTRISVVTASLCLLALLGCREEAQELTRPGVEGVPVAAVRANGLVLNQLDRDRKDTPWQRMSDPEFSEAVTLAKGRVVIGLKNPARSEGVDNAGRVLASATDFLEGKAALRTLGVEPIYEFKRTPVIVADISSELAVALRRNPRVDYIEPSVSGRWHSQVTPWGVTKVNAPSAWSLGKTGSGVKLLIMDSGIDSTARDLSPYSSWRCLNEEYSSFDHFGHGTAVAGVAAAVNNSLDVIGAAYGVTLYSANIDIDNAPNSAEAACAVEVARANGIDVVNMSVGFASPLTSLTDQINGGYNNDDMIFVASVGNDNGSVTYPATLSNVIAVTATDSTNTRLSTANTGSAIDLAAPGVNVLTTSLPVGTTCTTGGYTAVCTGTSLAAPHVSGAAALLRQLYPSWTNADIRTRLLSSATDLGTAGFDNNFGNGLLNIAKAIEMTVAVSWPSFVWSGYAETWASSVSGGVTPLTYQWYINGSAQGTSSSLNYTPGGSNFWVKVQVTDNLSRVAKDSMFVTVSNCTPPEIFC